jgi:hypothetical protein
MKRLRDTSRKVKLLFMRHWGCENNGRSSC